MYDRSTDPSDGTCDAPVHFNWRRLKTHFDATDAEIAERVNLSLSTLERLRRRPESSLVRNLLRIRRETGISLDELLPADDSLAA
jgi:transcriptional regulator with XRE-family HTH domain